MNVIAAAEIAVAFLITQANFMNKLLGTAQLTAAQWAFAFLAAVSPSPLGGGEADRPPEVVQPLADSSGNRVGPRLNPVEHWQQTVVEPATVPDCIDSLSSAPAAVRLNRFRTRPGAIVPKCKLNRLDHCILTRSVRGGTRGEDMRRRYWRASALAGIFGLIMSVSTGVGLAAAHPGDGDETDAEHAKEDLASTSINQIEKKPALTRPRSRSRPGKHRVAGRKIKR